MQAKKCKCGCPLVTCQVKRGSHSKGNCWVHIREWAPNSRSTNYSNISVNLKEHTPWNTTTGRNYYFYSLLYDLDKANVVNLVTPYTGFTQNACTN